MLTEKYEDWNTYYHQLGHKNDLPKGDAFDGYLSFGTGGIRGLMGIGTNRINVQIVRRVTMGLIRYLQKSTDQATVVVSYDTRENSLDYAHAVVTLLATYGINVFCTPTPAPTPELSFATRYYHADAGIMITASHNPREYNGYKIYNAEGCQLTPDEADKIASEINRIQNELSIFSLDLKSAQQTSFTHQWSSQVTEEYLNHMRSILRRPKVDLADGDQLKLVYTPLHGTGLHVMTHAFKMYGFANVNVVKAQTVMDGRFATVKVPNPEYPETFDMAVSLAKKCGADLALATDPDADRLGVFVKQGDQYQSLDGNQLGAIFLEYLLTSADDTDISHKFIVKTIVTSDLIKRIADHYDIQCAETLTGFKYIGDAIARLSKSDKKFLFGCEESFGYLFGDFVRDKDAIQAGLVIAEAALFYKQQGLTLIDELEQIYQKYGRSFDKLIKLTLDENVMNVDDLMTQFRNINWAGYNLNVNMTSNYQTGITCHGLSETEIDLPKSNVYQVTFTDGSKITGRPSGTEPMCKFYVDATSQQSYQTLCESVQNLINRAGKN
ncbi:phospho-sugar mutase [Lapidilactobacillus bayanensis]|uniref:phospho-sugar mutase n=1 Tax=Lapidilactobacillus bayanensis TaxID=2485998 RepID=UPI000F775847|nr:phospho-sugar mutase [Lapidilactobacillus bayanensis]